MKNANWTVSRRTFLAGTASAISVPMFGTARAQSKTLTMVNYGGPYQDAHLKAVVEPFTKETGIEVKFTAPITLDKVKAMLMTNNVSFDMFLGGDDNTAAGSKLGFWEKLDASLFDLKDLAIQPAADFVVFEVYARGITWNLKKFPAGKHPQTFADFFDVQKFPGRRAIRSSVSLGVLETALLADGVNPKQLYPLDVERALKTYNRIKPHLVWSATTPQDTLLVQAGEVDFSMANSNRVRNTTQPGGGVPLGFSFAQNIIGGDTWAIPKGAPNKESAMRLIGYYMRPDVQTRLFDLLATTPVSKKAATNLSPDVRKWQPDLNNPRNVLINGAYWADNFEAINKRFQEWRIS